MVFYAAFNSISVISRRQITLFMSFLGFTSTRLGFEVSCPRTLPRKNPEDPVRLEPRTPGLRVKYFTTEPRGTPEEKTDITERDHTPPPPPHPPTHPQVHCHTAGFGHRMDNGLVRVSV